jgi:hypothetical protein
MRHDPFDDNEILRHQFIKEFSTFTENELIKTHNNYVNFQMFNPFLSLRFQCFRDELIRRGYDMKGIATFHDNGRLKTYNHKSPIFILKINKKKILVPLPESMN